MLSTKYEILCVEDDQRDLVDMTVLDMFHDYQCPTEQIVIMDFPLQPYVAEEHRKTNRCIICKCSSLRCMKIIDGL